MIFRDAVRVQTAAGVVLYVSFCHIVAVKSLGGRKPDVLVPVAVHGFDDVAYVVRDYHLGGMRADIHLAQSPVVAGYEESVGQRVLTDGHDIISAEELTVRSNLRTMNRGKVIVGPVEVIEKQ